MATSHPIPTDRRFHNLTGKKFGRLTVLSYAGRGSGSSLWNCVCDCGGSALSAAGKLKSGATKSCGCFATQRRREVRTTHGFAAKSQRPSEYNIWRTMKARCDNLASPQRYLYGGRGIKVCERWLHSFANFLADMGRRPSPKHSIDRIDNDGDYEPGNCRWATHQEQANNKRTNIPLVTFGGKTQSLKAWAAETGIDYKTLHARIIRGVPVERLFSTHRLHR